MTTPKISTLTRNRNLLAGVQKRFPTVTTMQSFPILGGMLTIEQIEAELQPIVNAAAAIAPARAALHAAIEASRTGDAEGAAFIGALKAAVYVLFGTDPAALADFGLLPKKPRKVPTTASKVVTVARRKATHALRNPLTPTEKKALKGTIPATIEIAVPGAVVTAPPAPPAAPPAATAGTQAGTATPALGGNGSSSHT